MKKLVTTGFTGPYSLVLPVILILGVFATPRVFAQGCVMTCPPNNPPVQISLSSACQDVITYAQIGVTISNCPGQIVVEIFDNGIPIGDVITSDMIGNTYMVIISHPDSGQSCMTNIMVVDKQAPIVVCPDDITLACTADLDDYNGIDPGDISDCSDTQVFIDDVLISSANCDNDIISQYVRTYIIVDEYENADTCEQLISLEKASLDVVIFPPHLAGITGLDCFPPPDTTPANTGIPTVGGNPIINGTFCNLSAIYNDIVVQLCSGSYKIFRTWTVYDWCENNIFIDSTQIIEVLDRTGPVVVAPPDMTVSTGPSSCDADVQIPPAIISEDCGDFWTVRMQGPFGTINSNGGLVPDLPVGIHSIIFIATNECDSVGMDTMLLTVQDLQPPVPVCNQSLVIPVNNVGTVTIPASVFNAASVDNCGNVYFKVKRMSAPVGYSCANPGNANNQFDDFIQFCCEDIPNNNIMVILRVYDLPPVPGPVSDTYLSGHFNDCMVQVEVQDKLPPQITCPSDLTISCLFPFTPENLDVFGTVVTSPDLQDSICIDDPGVPGDPGLQCLGIDGLAVDNCDVTVSSDDFIDVNNCGTGLIIRTFTATDDGGLQSTCQQTITIINFDLFDLSDISWPPDYTTFNICEIDSLDPEDLPAPFNEPVLNDGPCDLVGASYEDDVFDFSNSDQACFKILRTWTVIDWCQLNTQYGGIWSHLQVIKVMNNVGPVIAPIDDISQCSFDPECGGLTLDFEASADDDCSSAASLSWRYFIDLDNNNSFDFTSGIITDDSIAFTFDIPIGTHRILYTVWDHCGNISTEEQFVTIESCKPPSAKCIHGLSTNLMAMDLSGDGIPDWGMVTLQASMFDAGSDHPCGNAVTVAFSDNPLDVTKVYDCSHLGENEVELWVIDNNGLTDFCITTIDIQDNNNVCPQTGGNTGIISGSITVPGSGKLSGAMVYLDGSNLAGIPSADNGYFVFPSMPFGGQYVVRPSREGDARNGVTTLDLVRIQKHLLGIEAFSSPFQYIAADANNSQNITAIDIIQLKKLILGYYTELPSNHSWRFIDDAYLFPDPSNPWISTWPETYTINPFNSNLNDVNFDAVKIGDVNLTANLHAKSSMFQTRSSDHCDVEYSVQSQPEPGLYKVEVLVKDANLYNAIQFSFDWDLAGFDIVDVYPGDLLSNDNVRLPDQALQRASIAAFTTDKWEVKDLTLMTMWVREIIPNRGPFKLFLKPGPTEPMAYFIEDEEPIAVRLSGKPSVEKQIFNRPNPFRDRTIIHCESSVEETAVVNIYDMNGKAVHVRFIQLFSGQNEFVISKSELGGAGIYVYEIQSANQHSTNRMIIVD